MRFPPRRAARRQGLASEPFPPPRGCPGTAFCVGTDTPVHAQTLVVLTERREGRKAPLTRPCPIHGASTTWPSAIALGCWLPSKASLAEAHACVTSKESYSVNAMPLWSPQDPPGGVVTKV